MKKNQINDPEIIFFRVDWFDEWFITLIGGKYQIPINTSMVATVSWIYVDRLKANPETTVYKKKSRTRFVFLNVKRITAEVALDPNVRRIRLI